MHSSYQGSYKSAVFHGMIGASNAMQDLFHRIVLHAQSQAPVVITGETGTGKELVAHSIHAYSSRKNFSFVALNCTALNEELLESELFGHERGAFTGAIRSHRGRFERAHKGSLFLDEISDMPVKTQVKLLRVLEMQILERIGGEEEIPVDVRIIAAANISLEQAVASGSFRSDLYHRIAVLRIHVPPLRDREGDILLLVNFFLDNLNNRYKKNIVRLSPEAMKLLKNYHWPGNIRELRNVLERVYVETQGQVIGRNAFREWEIERDYLSAGDWNLNNSDSHRLSRTPIVPQTSPADIRYYIPNRFRRALPSGNIPADYIVEGEYKIEGESIKLPAEITEGSMRKAYIEANGNITRAAKILGIHKSTFYRHLSKFKLSRKELNS